MSPRWGMVVDVNRCVGCQTCTVACKHANATLPGVEWRRVLDVELGSFPDVERVFLVVGCQHCAEPPCVPVCPTGATFQREDGIVAMDYESCIGCGYCAVACPYQARTIAHEMRGYYGDRLVTAPERAATPPGRVGVAEKCTFCAPKVEAGLAAGLVPGIDPAATPACASACIAQAIHFGDFNEPSSNVSRLVRENRSFGLNEELGTEPAIRYLYEAPAVPGRDAAPDDVPRDDPAGRLAGPLQLFWDIRAAMNFTLGGMGSGLAVVATVLRLAGDLTDRAFLALAALSGLLVAAGLLFVFFEIGWKSRALLALRRPQTSWMTREIYAVLAFYPLLLADLAAPRPALHAAVGAAAAAFLLSQARILFAAKGVPAWRHPAIPWLIAVSGLLEGSGLALAATALAGAAPALLAALGLALAGAAAALWTWYRLSAGRHGVGAAARRALAETTPWLHAFGHVVPALGFLAALVAPSSGVLLALGGLAAAAGGAVWKPAIVTRAAHQQGFALPKLPQRGSGARAAPARL